MQYTSAKDEPLMDEYVKKLNDVLCEGQDKGLTLAAALNCIAQVTGIIMVCAYAGDEKREAAMQIMFDAAWHYTGMWEEKIRQSKAGGN